MSKKLFAIFRPRAPDDPLRCKRESCPSRRDGTLITPGVSRGLSGCQPPPAPTGRDSLSRTSRLCPVGAKVVMIVPSPG
jgi:hypothetical protein